MCKILFIDVDGTLINDHGDNPIISKNNIDSIKKFAKKNYVVLSSGRSKDNVIKIWNQINVGEHTKYISCNNGSQIVDMLTKKNLIENKIEKDIFDEIKNFLFDSNLIIKDSKTKQFYSKIIRDDLDLKINLNYQNYEYNDITSFKIPIVLGTKFEDGIKFCEFIKNKFTSIEATPAMVGKFVFVEIVNRNSNKGFSIEYISKLLNINTKNTIHIGDSINDIKAFKKSGLSIAMENSHDSVKSSANLITMSVKEDGVSHAIESFLIDK